MWQSGADRAHVAHHVELPVALPFRVLDLLEASNARDAGVVDENVETAESLGRAGNRATRPLRLCEVDANVRSLAHARRLSAAACHDPRAFCRQETRGLEADSGRRARDEARFAVESKLHALSVSSVPSGHVSSIGLRRQLG